MADSVTCDHCGKVAAKSLTGNWYKVARHVEPASPSFSYGRITGDYCTLDCLIKQAKARRRGDRESRANYRAASAYINGSVNLGAARLAQ